MFAKAFLPILTLALTVAAAPQVERRAACSNGRTANDAKVCITFLYREHGTDPVG